MYILEALADKCRIRIWKAVFVCVVFLGLCEFAAAGSAGAAAHGTGASTVEGENAETLDVTPPAGHSVEAETGSTPTTPRSQTGKKTKATVKRKVKRRQHAPGC